MAFGCRFSPTAGVSISGDGSDTNPYILGAGSVNLQRVHEEFNATDYSGDYGTSDGWRGSNSSPDVRAHQSSALNHPGILRITTPAVANNNAEMVLGNHDNAYQAGEVRRYLWVVQFPAITAPSLARIGIKDNMSVVTPATFVGAFFEFDSNISANWRVRTSNGGAITLTTSGVAVTATTWFQLEAIQTVGTSWQYLINGVSVATHATNLPSGAVGVGVEVYTQNATTRSIDLDYFEGDFVIGQRF